MCYTKNNRYKISTAKLYFVGIIGKKLLKCQQVQVLEFVKSYLLYKQQERVDISMSRLLHIG